MIPSEWLPVAIIITPLVTGFLLIPLGPYTSKKFQGFFATIASFLTFVFTVLLFLKVIDGTIVIHKMAGWKAPFGIVLVVDALNGFVTMVVVGIVMLATVYSIEYMKHDTGLSYYYSLLMLMLSGMVGVTLTGDLFNLFVFLEIASIAAYGLVAFRLTELDPLEAGFKYCIMGAVATSFILLAIGLLYGLLGTVNMADMAEKLKTGNFLYGAKNGNIILPIILAVLIWGFGIKAAVVPMHTWLPDAHPAAPSPISAILSGVFIKVGVYAMIRVLFTIYGIQPGNCLLFYVMTFGVITMVFAGFLALAQSDVKRMLAFSSIMNIGYILFGVGIGNFLGLVGGLFHLLNHAILKALLFLAAGSIIHQTGIRDMRQLGGLGRKMPITLTVFVIGGFGIAGVPPLNGFVSKWIIFKAAIETGQPILIFYVVMGVVMSAVAVAYIVNALRNIFFGESKIDLENVEESPPLMLIPMVILSAMVVILGIFPQFGFNLVEPAVKATVFPASYIHQVLGG